jgi:dephospho-CoA kinase
MEAAAGLLRVGLTGGIASGKTYVRERLAAAGLATVDLDRVTHELLGPGGAGVEPVAAAFGPAVRAANGGIDRRALGAIVFAAAALRRRLEAILHPLVRQREGEEAAAAAAAGARAFVTDAALLVETGTHVRFDRLLVADCGPDLQLERLRARDGLDEAAARARLGAQMPAAEKRRFAHVVVDTARSFAETDAQVAEVAGALQALSRPAPLRLPVPRARGALLRGPDEGARGLAPLRLLSVLAEEGPDLARLSRQLRPPAEGPWYEAAAPAEAGPGPETLAPALVVWCAARGADAPFVAAAAASLARLTHREAPRLADAVVAALALWDVAGRGRTDGLTDEALREWAGVARARAGADPGAHLLESLRAAGVGTGPAGTLGGAALGLAAGADEADAAADAVLQRLLLPTVPA